MHVHHEYPKWVTPEGGEARIVQNEAEEAEALASTAAAEPAPKGKRAAHTDEA